VDGGTHDRKPNRTQLRTVASVLADESWVESINVFPANRPDSLYCVLNHTYYPPPLIRSVSLEIQSYRNGDFHLTYLEDHHGEQWCCRWDRHKSPTFTRDHFHRPPDAQHDDGVNRSYPADLLAVLTDVVVPWVYARIKNTWED